MIYHSVRLYVSLPLTPILQKWESIAGVSNLTEKNAFGINISLYDLPGHWIKCQEAMILK